MTTLKTSENLWYSDIFGGSKERKRKLKDCSPSIRALQHLNFSLARIRSCISFIVDVSFCPFGFKAPLFMELVLQAFDGETTFLLLWNRASVSGFDLFFFFHTLFWPKKLMRKRKKIPKIIKGGIIITCHLDNAQKIALNCFPVQKNSVSQIRI